MPEQDIEAGKFSRLICYRLRDLAPEIVPGRPERGWMNATDERFAYRCLPLTIANSFGWELLLPANVTAEWNGGAGLDDISVEVDDEAWSGGKLAVSHFGHGVLTFQTGYLFRTDPAAGLLVRGVPNWPRDGIAPLEGLVETDWLPFSFTMNWQFTRPGRVDFGRGEPFCFISPVGYRALDMLVPEIADIADAPEERRHFETWSKERLDFNERLKREEPDAVRQGWQKWYIRGQSPSGAPVSTLHMSKLRLADPRGGGD